jgi:ketosteroid isomerase-like protein
MRVSLAVQLALSLSFVVDRELLAQQPAAEAQPAPEARQLEAELDAFRDGLFTAFNERKYEEMLKEYCHEGVIAIWQDGTTSKGHAGVLAEFDKLSQFIDKMQVQPTLESRLVLNDGKLVVSEGQMFDKYALSRGENVELKSRWTATLIKQDDRWRLISFSGTANAFDNQVVDLYLRQARYTGGGIGVLLGLAIGIAGAVVFTRKRK